MTLERAWELRQECVDQLRAANANKQPAWEYAFAKRLNHLDDLIARLAGRPDPEPDDD